MLTEDRPYLFGRTQTLMIVTGVVTGIFVVSVNQSMLVVSVPKIVGDLGGLSSYSWIFTIYFLASTITIPTWARLSDQYGRRPLFTLSIATFLVGSLVCAFGADPDRPVRRTGAAGRRRRRHRPDRDGGDCGHHGAAPTGEVARLRDGGDHHGPVRRPPHRRTHHPGSRLAMGVRHLAAVRGHLAGHYLGRHEDPVQQRAAQDRRDRVGPALRTARDRPAGRDARWHQPGLGIDTDDPAAALLRGAGGHLRVVGTPGSRTDRAARPLPAPHLPGRQPDGLGRRRRACSRSTSTCRCSRRACSARARRRPG